MKRWPCIHVTGFSRKLNFIKVLWAFTVKRLINTWQNALWKSIIYIWPVDLTIFMFDLKHHCNIFWGITNILPQFFLCYLRVEAQSSQVVAIETQSSQVVAIEIQSLQVVAIETQSSQVVAIETESSQVVAIETIFPGSCHRNNLLS